jgi:uncharacterized protein YegL
VSTQPLHDDIEHPLLGGSTSPLAVVVDLSETIGPFQDAMLRYLDDGFRRAALKPEIAESTVVAIVVINNDQVTVASPDAPFVPITDVRAPEGLVAAGVTPLHDAVDRACTLIEQHHAALKAAGRLRNVGNVLIVTDGEPTDAAGYPTDAWRPTAERIRTAREEGRIMTSALGFGDANGDVLRAFAPATTAIGALPQLASLLQIVTMSSSSGSGDDGIRAAEASWQRICADMFGGRA